MIREERPLKRLVEQAAIYLSASFFVVLGAINVAHNLLPLFAGGRLGGGANGADTWWPVLLGMVCFGIVPLSFGIWLVRRKERPN